MALNGCIPFAFFRSYPISVVVHLKYLSDASDHLTHNCTTDFPISGTITENTPSISNHCQFNRTGKFQLNATFENDASSYQQDFSFTISDGNGCITLCGCFGIVEMYSQDGWLACALYYIA